MASYLTGHSINEGKSKNQNKYEIVTMKSKSSTSHQPDMRPHTISNTPTSVSTIKQSKLIRTVPSSIIKKPQPPTLPFPSTSATEILSHGGKSDCGSVLGTGAKNLSMCSS
jgi:hypothetical protein